MPDDPKLPEVSIDAQSAQDYYDNLPSDVKTAMSNLEQVLDAHGLFVIALMLGKFTDDGAIDGCFSIPNTNKVPRALLFSMIADTALAYKKRLQQ